MKLKILFIFLFIILSPLLIGMIAPLVNAAFYYENFTYSDAFANHGWQYLNTACVTDSNFPNNFSWNYNDTSTCAGNNGNRIIRRNLPPTMQFLTDDLTVEYDYTLLKSDAISTGISIILRKTNASATLVNIEHNKAGQNVTAVTIAGSQNCSVITSNPLFAHYTLSIDRSNNKYFLREGEDILCDKALTTNTLEIGAVALVVQRDKGANVEYALDNLNISDSILLTEEEQESCVYPIVFCDLFNYASPMVDQLEPNKWYVFQGLLLDDSYAPVNNELQLLGSVQKKPAHNVETFSFPAVEYQTGHFITHGSLASQFSSLMYLNISVGCFNYFVEDINGKDIYLLKGCTNGSTINYSRRLDSGLFEDICNDCGNVNEFDTIQIVTSFKQNGAMFWFNSSFDKNKVELYINNVSQGNWSFLDDEAYNTNQFEIRKTAESKFIIDNYYVLVGTDPNSDTIPLT